MFADGTIVPLMTWLTCAREYPISFASSVTLISSRSTIAFLTDTHHVKYKFDFPLDYIFIECNHTDELVDNSIKNGIIPRKVGIRAKATHMSLERCIGCLKACNTSKTKAVVLIHISANNGNSEAFRKAVAQQVGKPVYCAIRGLKFDFINI